MDTMYSDYFTTSSIIQKDNWLANVLGYPAFKIIIDDNDKNIETTINNFTNLDFIRPLLPKKAKKIFIYTKLTSKKQLDACYYLDKFGFKYINVDATFKIPNLIYSKYQKELYFPGVLSKDKKFEIAAISEKEFKYSRFHLDKQIKNADQIKYLWGYNLNSRMHVVVIQINNKIVGFVGFCKREDQIVIDLIAVDSEYQKRGIARDLMSFIFLYTKTDFIYATTQLINGKATLFYWTSCNGEIIEKTFNYHLTMEF